VVGAGRTEWTVEEYRTERGRSLFRAFISHLGRQDEAQAAALIKVLAETGNRLGLPHSRSLGGGLFELRSKQVRIFYAFRPARRIVLLDGMVKKRGDIPDDVLRRIRRLQSESK